MLGGPLWNSEWNLAEPRGVFTQAIRATGRVRDLRPGSLLPRLTSLQVMGVPGIHKYTPPACPMLPALPFRDHNSRAGGASLGAYVAAFGTVTTPGTAELRNPGTHLDVFLCWVLIRHAPSPLPYSV